MRLSIPCAAPAPSWAKRSTTRAATAWVRCTSWAATRRPTPCAAETNLRRLGPARLERWDATRLPLEDASVDRVVSNPPFGKQLSKPEEVGPLYGRMVPEYDRVLRPGGRAVLLVGEGGPLREAARAAGWKSLRQLDVRVLGQPAVITVWRKPG